MFLPFKFRVLPAFFWKYKTYAEIVTTTSAILDPSSRMGCSPTIYAFEVGGFGTNKSTAC